MLAISSARSLPEVSLSGYRPLSYYASTLLRLTCDYLEDWQRTREETISPSFDRSLPWPEHIYAKLS